MTEFLSLAMPPIAAWLADLAIQSSVLLLVALAVAWFCRQPAQRVVVAWSALVGLALLTAASLSPHWPRLSLLEPRATAKPVLIPADRVEPVLILTEASPGQQFLSELAPPETVPIQKVLARPPEKLPAGPVVLALVWLTSVLIACLWILLGSWQVRRVLRMAKRAPEWAWDELRQVVQAHREPGLKTTHRLPAAAAVGVWRPNILLPEAHVHAANRAGVQAALRHEWAHIRHGDLWLLTLERLLLPVFACHPLFWLLRRQLRIDQELLADAAAAGAQPVEYAEALLAWARLAGKLHPPAGLAALAMFENPHTLSRRIEMILNSQPVALRPSWLARCSLMLALFALAAGVSLVSMRPRWTHAQQLPEPQLPQDDLWNRLHGLRRNAQQSPEPQLPQVQPPQDQPLVRLVPQLYERQINGEGLFEDTAVGARQIKFRCQLMQVDQARLEQASDKSLGAMIQAVADGECTLEGNVVVAHIKPSEIEKVLREFRETKAIDMLSSPQILTLDGQEATIQVGSEVAVAEIEEIVKGQPRKQVQTHTTGTQLMILPRIEVREGSPHLELVVRAETTQHVGAADRLLVPAFKTRRMNVSSRLKSGEVLLLAEQPAPAKEGEKRNEKLLLIAITPELLAVVQAVGTPESAPDQATQADRAATIARKLEETNAVVDQLQANLKRAREALRAVVDAKVVEALRDDALPDALDRHITEGQGLANQIRKDRERLKLHELDLFTEEYRRNYQNLTKQNEDLRKQLDSLRQDLERIGARPSPVKLFPMVGKATVVAPQTRVLGVPSPAPVPQTPGILLGDAVKPPEDTIAEKQTTIFKLRHISAAEVVRIMETLASSGATLPKVAPEPRSNSLLVSGTALDVQLLKALIDNLDQPQPAPAVLPTNTVVADTQQRLLELDVREAETNFAALRKELERSEQLAAKGTVGEAEVQSLKLKVELAQIAVERAKLRLDAVRAPVRKAAPTGVPAPGTVSPTSSR